MTPDELSPYIPQIEIKCESTPTQQEQTSHETASACQPQTVDIEPRKPRITRSRKGMYPFLCPIIFIFVYFT